MSYAPHSQPGVKYDDWLKAWRSWAGTRKRGKMAQFIVHKLEENKQATWLDITKGKFQLTEWHTIAEEWFRQKPRSSDQVDAPCMLRKGLPRAFPGLDEVKTESIKEGTQYRSRVFQAPQALLQEVHLYINKPMYNPPSFVPNVPNGPSPAYTQSNPYVSQSPHIVPVTSNGLHQSQSYLSPTVKLEEQIDILGSPGSSSDHAHSPYDRTHSPYETGYPQTNYFSQAGSGMDDMSAHPVTSQFNGANGGSPYSVEDPSPPMQGQFPISSASEMLQVPLSEADTWSASPSSMQNSDYYSRSPDTYQQPISPVYPLTDVPANVPQESPGLALLQVQPFPNQSPLEGGGELALLFSGELPPGSKWLSFNSQARPSYMTQVEALQTHNPMALTAIIPKHDIPETVLLQVVINGQLIAQTEFTYYANAQYNSDMLFHYLTQNFHQYFPDVSTMGGAAGMDMSQGDMGGGGGGYYYSDNVPSKSYSLLLGACRLGIEEVVYATLELQSMLKINTQQLSKAQSLAEENGHANLAKQLKILAEMSEITSKGEGDEKMAAIRTNGGRKALEGLTSPRNPKECAEKVLNRLLSVAQMERRSKLEEQREGSNPATPTTPERPEFRRSCSNRLQRQENREDEDLLPLPSAEKHSRSSIAEINDTVPPLSSRPRGTGSMRGRRMLIATHSDAADSAISVSFDGEASARRGSGILSYNKEADCHTITFDADSAYTLANALQYECSYNVTDDYPPNADPSNVIFRAGDKIIQIGDSQVKDKGPDDFALLLQERAAEGIRFVPRVSPPPSSMSLSLGYGSLDLNEKSSLKRRQSDQQMVSSITMKVSNLLSMKPPGPKRTITIPRSTAEGFGFKLTGGNIVGLFVSEVVPGRDEIKVGDQVLEIGGASTMEMTHFDAQGLLKKAKDKIQLKVMENPAKFQAVLAQFEFESFYIRTNVSHTPTDTKEMTLQDGGVARVVNCSMDPNYWLAWAVDESTGGDTVLKKIPAPHKAHGQFGKHIYEVIPATDVQKEITTA